MARVLAEEVANFGVGVAVDQIQADLKAARKSMGLKRKKRVKEALAPEAASNPN